MRAAGNSHRDVSKCLVTMRMLERHAGRAVSELTATDVSRFLDRPNLAFATRASYFSGIVRFFRWYGANGGVDVAAPLRRTRKGVPGQPRKAPVSPQWAEVIAAYLHTLAAAGLRPATLRLRYDQLQQMARAMGCPPDEVTAELLVGWFGDNAQWSPETRRGNRSTAKGFFTWAYRAGRIAVYLGDEIAKVRVPKAAPRPAPDDAWEAALAAADPRSTLMLRLAAEVGMRCGEVAQVHTRDVLVAGGCAQLVVHGKGGKERIVPISEEIAGLIRRGAAGHTPGMPAQGWLFPDGAGGHLSPRWVCTLTSRLLPAGWTMHTLRHRFATRAYRGTRNLRAVQQLLGHASIATTERYTAVDDSEVRAAAAAAW